jgi:hypothetical protein
MTVRIDILNAPSRRCYNSDHVEAALKRTIQQRKASKLTKRDDDSATIRELGKLRGKEREAEIWIANAMGPAESFLKTIGAQKRRIARLFGNSPIR